MHINLLGSLRGHQTSLHLVSIFFGCHWIFVTHKPSSAKCVFSLIAFVTLLYRW